MTQGYVRHLILLVGVVGLATLSFAGYLHEETNPAWAVITILMAALFGLSCVRPLPFLPRLPRTMTIILCFLGAFISLGMSQSEVENRLEWEALQALKQSNPTAYLARMKKTWSDSYYLQQLQSLQPAAYAEEMERRRAAEEQRLADAKAREIADLRATQPEKYLEFLKTSDPQQYREVMAERGERIQKLLTTVRSVPASEVSRNALIYKDLLSLDPDNQAFRDKYNYYSWAEENCDETRHGVNLYSAAKQGIKSSLKAPRTAKFAWSHDVVRTGACSFRVTSFVDAQNGFGALIRTHYAIEAEWTPQGYKNMDLKSW